MSEEEGRKLYKEALKQVISLHVVHKRVEEIMELIDPFHPEMSDMWSVNQELKKFKDELLITIGENADIVWYIDEYKKREELEMELILTKEQAATLLAILSVTESKILESVVEKLTAYCRSKE